MWRLQDPERAPRVLIAPVRALVQRLGPHVEDVEPIIVRPGEQRDRDEFVAALVGAGYRREEIVEHRGEVAVRGSLIDAFPSTADRPVRIDLWGDERWEEHTSELQALMRNSYDVCCWEKKNSNK